MKNVFTLVNVGFSQEIVGMIQHLVKKSRMGIIISQSIEGEDLGIPEIDFYLQEECDLVILNSLGFSCPIVEVVTFLKGKFPLMEIILISFQQNYKLAVNAFRGGVRDVIEYPLPEEDFLSSLGRSLNYRSLIRRSENLTKIMGLFNLFGDYRRYESKEQLFIKIDDFLKKKFNSSGYMILQFPQDSNKSTLNFEREEVFWNRNLFDEEYFKRQNQDFFMDLDLQKFKYNGPQHIFKKDGGDIFYFFNLGLWEDRQYAGLFKVSRVLEDEMVGYLSRILYHAFQQILHLSVEKELSFLVHSDDVTGLYNQRRLQVDMERAIKGVQNKEGPFSILFIDIDHFKEINDNNGHLVGSLVLGELANELRKTVRETDLIYRYGGDEFVIILLNTNKEIAKDIGARIVNVVKQKKFHGSLSDRRENPIQLSVSIGVAEFPQDAQTKEGILGLADRMMYLAKESGRGQVRMVAAQTKPNE